MPLIRLKDLAANVLRTTAHIQSWTGHADVQHSLEDFFVEPTLVDAHGGIARPAEAIGRSRGTIIVGPPGSGKTTVLRFLAHRQSADFVAGASSRLGLYVGARELGFGVQEFTNMDLPRRVGAALVSYYQHKNVVSLVRNASTRGTITLFLDGLDEVPLQQQAEAFRALNDARARYPHLQLVCSSRQSIASDLPGFRLFRINELTDESMATHLANLSKDNPAHAQKFIQTVQAIPHLAHLISNPLLLTLLWRIFISSGRLATTPAFLHGDMSDYLLSTWENKKGILKRSRLSIADVHTLLEELAFHQVESQQHALTHAAALKIISQETPKLGITSTDEETLDRLLTTGILREVGHNALSFNHRTFLEFYAAKALTREPHKLIKIANTPSGNVVAAFAAELIEDVQPLVEAAIKSRHLTLAAKCISSGRLQNAHLAQHVAEGLGEELGGRFAVTVTNGRRNNESMASDVHATLLGQWRRIKQPRLQSFEKGRRLERFAQAFFGQFFRIVSSNLNTEHGEIDIILENSSMAPFWLEWGADILVECKNWNSSTPLHDVGAFSHKATHFRARLVFFLSTAGFTSDAKQSMRNQSISGIGPVLVPIAGEDIERALMKRELLEEFLKSRIREIKYLQKY